MRLVLLGPPGVGKGTQGRRLAQEHRWALISTGEMLRDAVARQTPLGREAQKTMEDGLLVGDDVMIGLVRERSIEHDANDGFVLDGFPRTVPQADALDSMPSSITPAPSAQVPSRSCSSIRSKCYPPFSRQTSSHRSASCKPSATSSSRVHA